MATMPGARSAPRPMVAANWKMNGLRRDGLDLARNLAERARAAAEDGAVRCDVVICPPATLLVELRSALDGSGIALGGQDCHSALNGAHTGDISVSMLVDAGCTHVIVGHSERRADHGEGDGLICAKAEAARAQGLTPIICVGETETERKAGQAADVVSSQLRGSVPEGANAGGVVIAYEPVWAVGTGRTPSPDDIAEMHGHIRGAWENGNSGSAEDLRVLYGGSVKASNAPDILDIEDVDGALVGGASLNADEFWAICSVASRRK